MNLSDVISGLAPIFAYLWQLLEHPIVWAAAVACIAGISAFLVYSRREALNQVRCFWVMFEDQENADGTTTRMFILRSEETAHLSVMFDGDSRLQRAIKRAAVRYTPLVPGSTIDFIPTSPHLRRLAEAITVHLSSRAPTGWYGMACRLADSTVKPGMLVTSEPYSVVSDKCHRAVLMHPAVGVELLDLPETRALLKAKGYGVEKEKHFDLLLRLIRWAAECDRDSSGALLEASCLTVFEPAPGNLALVV